MNANVDDYRYNPYTRNQTGPEPAWTSPECAFPNKPGRRMGSRSRTAESTAGPPQALPASRLEGRAWFRLGLCCASMFPKDPAFGQGGRRGPHMQPRRRLDNTTILGPGPGVCPDQVVYQIFDGLRRCHSNCRLRRGPARTCGGCTPGFCAPRHETPLLAARRSAYPRAVWK